MFGRCEVEEAAVSTGPFRKDRGRRDAERARLFAEQNGRCYLCGRLMTLQRKIKKNGGISKGFATFDHVVPRKNGGTAYFTNIKLAHRKCNNRRGAKPIEQVGASA